MSPPQRDRTDTHDTTKWIHWGLLHEMSGIVWREDMMSKISFKFFNYDMRQLRIPRSSMNTKG